MTKTKVEWADMTWNPVTGCLRGCGYCYARGIARRFGEPDADGLRELSGPGGSPYPFGFAPTLHRYRLGEPAKLKKPRTIFVCSMADLFGEWVPDGWTEEVFKACGAAPRHRYLFLTKNPHGYIDRGILAGGNFWYGQTQDGQRTLTRYGNMNAFLSLEPLTENPAKIPYEWFGWVIVGAGTGRRRGKIIPKREWAESVVGACKAAGVPVFLKDSLADVWGRPLPREFPWKEN